MDIVRALLWIGGSSALLIVLFLWMSRLLRTRPLGVRAAASVVAAISLQYLIALGLLIVGAFGSLAAFLLGLSGIAVLVHSWRSGWARERLSADLSDVSREVSPLLDDRRIVIAAGVLGLLVLTYVIRGLLIPPIDWDYLTYHGTRAALWLTEGTLESNYDAVGFWQNYKAFPVAADAPTAWAMTINHNDQLVPFVWTIVWGGCGWASYTLSRLLGAKRIHALLFAVSVVMIPGCFQHMSSGYVDNLVLLATLSGLICLLDGERSGAFWSLSMGLMGFAVAVGIKLTAALTAIAAGIIWLSLIYRNRDQVTIPRLAATTIAVVATSSTWAIILWVTYDNPVYPFSIDSLGWKSSAVLQGRQEVDGFTNRSLTPAEGLVSLFWQGFFSDPRFHNGLGLGSLVLFLGGLFAMLGSRAKASPALAFITLTALGWFAWFLMHRMGFPALDHGRYLLMTPALLGLWLSLRSERWVSWLLGFGLLGQLVHLYPWRWSDIETVPVTICVVIFIVVSSLGFWVKSDRRRSLAASIGAGFFVAVFVALSLRPLYRWDYYEAAARNEVIRSGPIVYASTSHAWTIWRDLGPAQPKTVAVSAGPARLPTHWLVYPLLGERFQHSIVHVRSNLHNAPTPIDAEIFERERVRWWSDLGELEVDYLVLYPPMPPEAVWADSMQESFVPVQVGTRRQSVMFEVNRFAPASSSVGPEPQ